ncbi:MAG: peptide chain release factor N(5)-glutamine methyltransferase [Pseudorhodobacter sp.]
MTRLFAARRAAVARLDQAGVPGAAQDVAALLAFVLEVDRSELALMSPQTELSAAQEALLEAALAARAARQPVSQITGTRLFWGRAFSVTSDVLDPRPETEVLIEAALSVPFASVLDLGTGTGCILLTLLLERPEAQGSGVDLSAPALGVARRNQQRLAPHSNIVWAQGSWFDPVQGRFDLIISNPPYIAADEMAGLSPEVRDWEPHMALSPGADGLQAYRLIAASAPQYLMPGGWLMVEIGASQGTAVKALFTSAGLSETRILPDLDGRDRVVIGRFLSP